MLFRRSGDDDHQGLSHLSNPRDSSYLRFSSRIWWVLTRPPALSAAEREDDQQPNIDCSGNIIIPNRVSPPFWTLAYQVVPTSTRSVVQHDRPKKQKQV